MAGIFVVFEGIDGSGKSTALEKIAAKLTELNLPVIKTRQPGGTDVAEKIRELCLTYQNAENENLTDKATYLLMLAARTQLVETLIKPAILENKIILCDRHDWSSVAYQGHQSPAFDRFSSIKPDLIIWLDKDLDKAVDDIKKRGEAISGFESIEKLKTAHRRYTELAKLTTANNTTPIMRIDANDYQDENYQLDIEVTVEIIKSAFSVNKDK